MRIDYNIDIVRFVGQYIANTEETERGFYVICGYVHLASTLERFPMLSEVCEFVSLPAKDAKAAIKKAIKKSWENKELGSSLKAYYPVVPTLEMIVSGITVMYLSSFATASCLDEDRTALKWFCNLFRALNIDDPEVLNGIFAIADYAHAYDCCHGAKNLSVIDYLPVRYERVSDRATADGYIDVFCSYMLTNWNMTRLEALLGVKLMPDEDDEEFVPLDSYDLAPLWAQAYVSHKK